MPCEPVSWRLLDMKTEAVSAKLVQTRLPALQTQKVKFSARRLVTQLAQVQVAEEALLRAAQRPALRLPSRASAATPPSITRSRIWLGQLSHVQVSPESDKDCVSTMQTPSHV